MSLSVAPFVVASRAPEMLHAGVLLCFALLLVFRRAVPHVRDEDLVRVFRATGAMLGVTLGLVILRFAVLWALVGHPGQGWPDSFGWETDVPFAQARLALLACYWVSYVAFEIWTLEPMRLLDRGEVSDRPAYTAALGRVVPHLCVNAALFGAFAVMGEMGVV
jgi:hypothetical protein